MQTFLPYEDYARSASVLDRPRLGKQRVETLQVLRALVIPDYGWQRHPVVQMWTGYVPALVSYGLACTQEWTAGGAADTTAALITEFAPEVAGVAQEDLARAGHLPPWTGDERLHLSHRSNLVRKDPERYRPVLGAVPDDLPYWWPGVPEPPQGEEPDDPREGRTGTWVVRAPDADLAQEFLALGYVGLDTSCGVDVDAAGRDRGELAALLRERAPGRRPGKALRQLSALLADMQVGDDVALLVEDDRALVTGVVTGDYVFETGRLAPHVRPVAWGARADRAAVPEPATLQDPRALFRLRWSPSRQATATSAGTTAVRSPGRDPSCPAAGRSPRTPAPS